jgi:integrase
MKLTAFFSDTYCPMRLLGASPGSIQQYQIAIHALEKHLKREPLVSDLNADTVTRFIEGERKRGMAIATINARLRHLFALARLVRQRKLFDADLDELKLFKEKRPAPVAWTEEEMERLIASCRLARGRFMGVTAAAWWESLTLLLYDSGLRRSAAMQVRFEEIDFTTGMLRVPAERMKNGVEQFFKLHHQTVEAILGTLPPRRKLVFPWPFTHYRSLYGRFKVILRRAGLPFSKRDMFHKVRRTTASHTARLLGEGVASMQLGHQDQSTIKRYVDPRFTARHDASDFLPRPGWLNPREIVVKADAPATQPMGEPVTVTYSQADLRGEGDDVFARLATVDEFRPADVKAALDALGMHGKELADEIGVQYQSLMRMLRERKPLSVRMSKLIRTALGIDFDRSGQAGRARKAGAA